MEGEDFDEYLRMGESQGGGGGGVPYHHNINKQISRQISYRLITALVIADEFFEHRRSSTLRTEFDSNVSNRSPSSVRIQKK